jgi:glycosyltransferase involved in cell wall biosynthesis
VLIAHPSPDLYGSDRVLLESVSAFVDAGFRTLAALPADGPLAGAINDRGAEAVVCPSPVLRKSALKPRGILALFGETLRALPASRRLIRATRPDLIYVNTVTIPLWLVVGRCSRLRVVCHVHEAERSLSRALRRVLYLPLLLAHRLVVNSSYTADVLAEPWGGLRRRSTLIYNGVPGPAEPPRPARSPLTEPHLLFVGRLSPRKGPQVAIEALHDLRRSGTAARLSLLGAVFPGYEWFETQLREQVARLDLADHVAFLGFDTTTWPHFADHDIVLVPSIADESFGNVVVEAILADRPVVVSAASGLREAAAGYATARQVVPNDPAAIADAVRDLVGQWPSVIEQSAADRQRAIARHGVDSYRRRLIEFVRTEVLQDRRTPAE